MAERLIYRDTTDAARDVSSTYPLPVSSSAYDPTTGAENVTITNPPNTAFAPMLQMDTLGIPVATPVVVYVDVEGVGEVVVHYDIVSLPSGPGTLTLTAHASGENNGTADSAASYVDILQYGTIITTGPQAASLTADGAFRFNCKGWKFLRLTITATSADNGIAALYVNRAY
jgi:hypothetical protein